VVGVEKQNWQCGGRSSGGVTMENRIRKPKKIYLFVTINKGRLGAIKKLGEI
jgi:hypothetical protein